MLDIQNVKINTAGVYVCIDGCYVFAIGIKPHNGHIPVVRIGGHREGVETGWQCAVREVLEETSLQLEPRWPQFTYVYDWDHFEAEPARIQWQQPIQQEPAPFVVVTYHRDGIASLSLMYFADAQGIPVPSSEVKGLLLLTETEIHGLCQESITLSEFLRRGGKVILNAEFDVNRVLEPFAQLRLLSRILRSQPEVNAA